MNSSVLSKVCVRVSSTPLQAGQRSRLRATTFGAVSFSRFGPLSVLDIVSRSVTAAASCSRRAARREQRRKRTDVVVRFRRVQQRNSDRERQFAHFVGRLNEPARIQQLLQLL